MGAALRNCIPQETLQKIAIAFFSQKFTISLKICEKKTNQIN